MMPSFTHSRFDDFPQENWTVEQKTDWSVRRMINHEEVCAQRWGVVIKLMWAVLSGIGLILIAIIGSYVNHLFNVFDKLSQHG